KDFHFKSLHELITPLVMTLGSEHGTMIAKVRTTDMPALLNDVKNKWTNLHPDSPFSYSFLDDRVNNTYKSEQNIARILGIFAGLTIFVASLGLFALATFTAEQRTKEIGIRKVLGANLGGIISLLSKDFIRNILVAFVIALPVAWFVMNQWLQDFAYRIIISWWMFVIAGVLAILIALFTISFRVIRVAIANPVKSLRTE
ncbi:MAG TPA: FtsX-like permease family protein, partial [Chitinophagaceae bacterium]|nr:FtsX-like permease family protein [Chitinophagaceae bacterium]